MKDEQEQQHHYTVTTITQKNKKINLDFMFNFQELN